MLRLIYGFLITWFGLAMAGAAQGAELAPAVEVVNFALIDHTGRMHELKRLPGKAVVLFFTANGCPVARQSAAKLKALQERFESLGVQFFLVNSNAADDRESIAREAFELKTFQIPTLKDETQGLASHLGVRRTGECIVIGTRDWTIRYRGAIDDQLVEGAQKPKAGQRYLDDALVAVLEGRPVAVERTSARGCLITFEGGTAAAAVSYEKQVAPILLSKCAGCHSAGNVGPWSMTDHARVQSMAAMIEEVILARRMPPWDADPVIGKFHEPAALTIPEAQTVLRWIKQGAARGEGSDPLAARKPAPAADWPLGPPDTILRLPRPEHIPATGVLEYRHIDVAVGNVEARWVTGAWVKPGNKEVVHHAIAWLKKDDDRQRGPGEREHVAGYAPGSTQGWYPSGTGKLLPKNAQLDIEMHYTTNGVAQTDQTEIGLYFAKDDTALKPLDTLWIYNAEFQIRPGDSDSTHHAAFPLKQDAIIYDLMPHMHLRGRWMKFEVLLPSGKRETLLSVPRYDFNWQRTYSLAEPRKVPAGSWLLISGGYDNSHLNPANPDPAKTIRWGDQSFEEMFLGIVNVTWESRATTEKLGGE